MLNTFYHNHQWMQGCKLVLNRYDEVSQQLISEPKIWLITGVAGFIGSNLLEALLKLNQRVVGLDNFSTGHQHNIDEVKTLVSTKQWNKDRQIAHQQHLNSRYKS